jgi:exportin-1
MIAAEPDAQKRDEYTQRLMALPNSTWRQLMAAAAANPETLKSPDAIRSVANILQTNTAACSSLGQPFASQVALIYTDVLLVYRLYSCLLYTSDAADDYS